MAKAKTYKNFNPILKTIPEYADLIPPLTKEKFEQLKANIKQDKAIFDPLIVNEQGIILDGHNRYKIAEQLDLSFKTEVRKMESIEDGIVWIIKHQIGRRDMTKDQLSVMGLKLLPYYRKIMKERQSKGGTDKEKMGKNLKTSQLVAKEMNINETLIKNITSLNKNIPEVIPMIREGDLLVNEAKHLRNVCAKGAIVVDGKFTRTAKAKLDAFRYPVLTPQEIEEQELEKKLAETKKKNAEAKKKKDKEAKEAKDKAEKAALEKVAKEKAERQLDVDPDDIPENGPGPISPTDNGPTEGTIEKLSDDHLRKLSIFMSRVDGEVKNEKESKIFTEKADFVDATENPKIIADSFVDEYIMHKKAQTESGYAPNVIMAIPNTQLYRSWNQKASSTSSMYCDSKRLPVRFLYFGDEEGAFFDHFKQYGNVSVVSKFMPNLATFSESLKDLAPAKIETLTPPKQKSKKSVKAKTAGA